MLQPDVAALQQTLHIQLVNRPLPEASRSDARLALGELQAAALDVPVLLVLDDVWEESHADPLNFVDKLAEHSAVVVTTRMRSLLDGAAEIQCGMLTTAASLELLLRAGGCEHLLVDPPPAALEAVELCGHLPLALGIAGGIITELADSWQKELCTLLRDELGGDGGASVEERVVSASLRAIPSEMREPVIKLATLFAVRDMGFERICLPALIVAGCWADMPRTPRSSLRFSRRTPWCPPRLSMSWRQPSRLLRGRAQPRSASARSDGGCSSCSR